MAYSLMFALPGTPTLFYGEEIGMGENLDVDDRLAVRTPMQWTGDADRRVLHRTARRAVPAAADGRAVRAGAVNVATSAPIRSRCSTGSSG